MAPDIDSGAMFIYTPIIAQPMEVNMAREPLTKAQHLNVYAMQLADLARDLRSAARANDNASIALIEHRLMVVAHNIAMRRIVG